jgi:RNA polymerase sigma factor (sigma-70 family)
MFRMPSSPVVSPTPPVEPPIERTDTHWFIEEIRRHEGSLRSYIRGAFPAVRDVDDVVQESYLRLWRARTVHPILCAKAFLFRVARNVAIDWARSRRASPIDPGGALAAMTVVDDALSGPETAILNERAALLADALDALPSRCREMVICCKLQGRSYKEAAMQFGVSEKTVAEHVYRGAQRLGQELIKRGVGNFSS